MDQTQTYRSLQVREIEPGRFERAVVSRPLAELPHGDVLIRVQYSSLNYKDALSASGNKGVTRQYPHTPGIDAAGIVVSSSVDDFQPGQIVVVGNAEFGANAPGGFSEYVRVPAGWVLALPAGLSTRECMAYGTAGITAALSVLRLQEQGVAPGDGEVLVTGASGGVGSLAVAILAQAGYRVVAATGKEGARAWLTRLGAHEIISREQALDTSGKGLLKGRWAGVVDTVGGGYLATALKSTLYGGVVTCCGNVASAELVTSVYPFILRGVRLIGIDIANCPLALRQQLWHRLATDWHIAAAQKPASHPEPVEGDWLVSERPFGQTSLSLDDLVTECSLDQLDGHIQRILRGEVMGRIVVNLLGV